MTIAGDVNKRRKRGLNPLLIGLVGLIFGAYVVGGLLVGNDWNPTTFVKFPDADPAAMFYAQNLLGDVVPSPGFGHDGKFYFSQAMDPFYLNPDEHASFLDRPTYRAQRMLYPTIAGGLGFFSPSITAWSLLVLNVVGLGLGSWLTALLARELGLSSLFGLAFALNPGIFVSALVDTAEVFAMLFFVLVALFTVKARFGAATVAMTLAALSRETMLLAAAGWIIYLLYRKIPVRWYMASPFVLTVGWWLYLRVRIGYLVPEFQDTRAVGLPFEGFIEAFRNWTAGPVEILDLGMGVILLALAFVIPWRAIRTPTLLGFMAAGFSLIAFLMVEPVWKNYFDSARVLAPFVTVYLLTVPRPLTLDPRISGTGERHRLRGEVQLREDRPIETGL